MKRTKLVEAQIDFENFLNQEMAMYDDLAKNDKYKADREKSAAIWDVLKGIRHMYENTIRDLL